MDDAKVKEKLEDVKCKAKAFMKNLSSGFGSSSRGSSSGAFKGQGHKLGGSAEPSYGAPPAPSNGGGACRKLGPGFHEQQQQQNDFRRLQQERWEREKGVAPAQTSYQPPPYQPREPSSANPHRTVSQPPSYQPREPSSANPHRSVSQPPSYQAPNVIHSGGTLASAAASVKSPTPDGIRVERESRGTVQVGNLPPAPSQFDPYSPIIASGTSHRPAVAMNRGGVVEPQGQFQCPICQKWWQSEAQVSEHIDHCTGGAHSELARLSIRREEESRPRQQKGHVIEDLDDAVCIFISGGPSKATIEVILRVFRNILNAPNEEKYRTLRLSKPMIKETIGSAIGGLKFCESVGFRLVDESLIMEHPSVEKQERIQAAIAYLDSYYSATTTAAVDSSLPNAPSLQIPKNFDRKLRVFYVSKDHAATERFDVPDSFYNLSATELRNEAAARRKKLEDSQMLIPKSWKEKQAAIAKKRYKGTVVRVQLPDGLLVQGFFKPGEATSSLYEFVASTLKDSNETFDLVLPAVPRHRVIPRYPDHTGRCLTLEEADLVPKALLKFNATGPQGYTCLRSECYALCEPL